MGGVKCDGDNVVRKTYSDAQCTTEVTVANGGEIVTFTSTSETKTELDNGVSKTETSTDTVGISTCKGGVAEMSAAEKAAASPTPTPTPTATPSSSTGALGAGSLTQCSTLALLIVVAAMWA